MPMPTSRALATLVTMATLAGCNRDLTDPDRAAAAGSPCWC